MISAPASRNDPCPCGSGQRYKQCHGALPAGAPQSQREGAPPPAEQATSAVAHGASSGPEAQDSDALRARARAARPHDAAALWSDLLRVSANDVEALYSLGNIAAAREDDHAASQYYERALAAHARHPDLLNNLGIVYDRLGRTGDAEQSFRRALDSDPKGFAGNVNLAQNLYRQGRFAESLMRYERVAPQIQSDAWALANMGVCLTYAGRYREAEQVLERARKLIPDSPSIACDVGLLFGRQQRWVEAAGVLEEAWRMAGNDLRTASLLQFARANICDWRDTQLQQFVIDRLAPGTTAIPVDPYPSLAFTDDPAVQLAAARRWSAQFAVAMVPVAPAAAQVAPVPAQATPARVQPAPASAARNRTGPLRLGFVSSDFANHPVTRLLLGLLERVDSSRFTLFAYSTQAREETLLRTRLRKQVRAMRDIARRSPAEQAKAIRGDAIDILVDLNGFSGELEASLFALRPASLQVSFLYAGTLGSAAYDCIVADDYCLPSAERGHYEEAPLLVDPCYLPSDPLRGGSQPLPQVTRGEYGLPQEGFVFAAWQAHYKITAQTFAVWMDLLRRAPGSVLWLRDGAEAIRANLAREAQRHGVDAGRLVFSAADPLPRYLARMRLADLMLDSFPYGAHTTVNDALFAGVPVVTRTGRSFASRASASQLIAVGLPQLVAASDTEYAEVAAGLAANRTSLAELTDRLRREGPMSPLFDMDRYARVFQRALEDAWSRRQARLTS